MAQQSLLAKLGARVGTIGSAVTLAIAAPIVTGNYDPTCHTDSARIGWMFDRTAGAEASNLFVGGVNGVLFNSSGVSVSLTLYTPNPVMTQGDGTGTPSFTLNGMLTTRNLCKQQTALVNRNSFQGSNEAESGSDAGSRFFFRVTNDNGSSSASAIALGRQLISNAVTFSTISVVRPIVFGGGTFTTNIILYSLTTEWNFNAALIAFTYAITDTASNAASLLMNIQKNSSTVVSIRKDAYWLCNSSDDLTGPQVNFSRAFTLTGSLTDVFQLNWTAVIGGAFTITRYSWIELDNITGAATVTDGAVFYFNANAGTHCAIDAATTKVTPATVGAWIKHNINGTIYFAPCYASKTA